MATEQLTGCAARGARVVDPHRVEYLDCGGYGVPLLGHAHPAVVQAVVGQVRRPSLLDRLMLDLVTPNGLDHIHTFPSASEAAQFAVALAHANGRPRVLTTGDVPYGGIDSLRAVLASGPPACVLVEPVRGVSCPPNGYLTAIAGVIASGSARNIFVGHADRIVDCRAELRLASATSWVAKITKTFFLRSVFNQLCSRCANTG